jgi:hypothetical protein
MFYLFNQQYYLSPIIDDNRGIGKEVIIEAENKSRALDILREKGFDLEDEVPLDPYSEYTVRVWDEPTEYSSWEEMFCNGLFYLADSMFIHLLDGRVLRGFF